MTELMVIRSLSDDLFEPVGDGWTVTGRAVPYGVDQLVRDGSEGEPYRERFEPGAFHRDVRKGGRWINLMLGHSGDDGDRYLGRCISLEERDDGLYPSFRINREHPLAEQARSGELTGWSVGARVYQTRIEQNVRVRVMCGLNHVAATAQPQYAGAGVLALRDHTTITPAPTPVRDALAARLDKLRDRALSS